MTLSQGKKIAFLLAAIAAPATIGFAQQPVPPEPGLSGTVTDTSLPDRSQMTKGPEIEGIISARSGDRMQVTTADGVKTVVRINDATTIKASKGFLGLAKNQLPATALLNGLPVSVETLQAGGALVASRIDLKNKDLRTATMIRNGTEQGFAEQSAATEALRGRLGDIDK